MQLNKLIKRLGEEVDKMEGEYDKELVEGFKNAFIEIVNNINKLNNEVNKLKGENSCE